MTWNCISKALHFLQITAKNHDCPVYTKKPMFSFSRVLPGFTEWIRMEHVVRLWKIIFLTFTKKLLRLNQHFLHGSLLFLELLVVKESSDSLFPGERRLISLQYSGKLAISLRIHCLLPDMFCTAFNHAKPPRNIHAAREVTLSRF